MPNNYRVVLGFLYVLLFFSFVGISLGQPAGRWLTSSYGGWVTVEAFSAYIAYVIGLIWLINRISKAAGIEAPSSSPSEMVEMDLLVSSTRPALYSETRSVDLPQEAGSKPDIKF